MKSYLLLHSFLPNAPYFHPIYGTGTSSKIYDFGRRIPRLDMNLLYAQAVYDAVSIHHRAAAPMGPVIHTYNITIPAGDLGLHLAPGDFMTWQMWAWVCNGLPAFMKRFEYVELKFDVEYFPYGTVAQGSIEVRG